METEREWWKNKLAEDIFTTLLTKEQTIPVFYAHSPQLCARRHLVDWISLLVEKLVISATAQHLAVYLLDYFLDSLKVSHAHLYLLTMACLLIAVKFEEHTDKVPSLAVLNAYLPQTAYTTDMLGYHTTEYSAMELTVLKFFDWKVSAVTVPHFLPYFLMVAVDSSDLHNGVPINKSRDIVKCYVEKHSKYFQEISLQDHLFRSFRPSLIAASCVASARICLRLTPTWPKQLELMTDFYLEELLPCVQMMLSMQQQDDQNHPPLCQSQMSACMYRHIQSPAHYLTNYLPNAVFKQPVMQNIVHNADYITTFTPNVYASGPHIIPGCRGS